MGASTRMRITVGTYAFIHTLGDSDSGAAYSHWARYGNRWPWKCVSTAFRVGG